MFLVVEAIWFDTHLLNNLGVVKTAETIESLTQPEFLYPGLKNYAERQSEDRPGTLLESMAGQATALMLAEAATQEDGSAVAVEERMLQLVGLRDTSAKQLVVVSFVHEIPQDLQCFPMIFAICVVEDVSKHLHIPIWEF